MSGEHDHAHGEHHAHGAPHGSLNAYVTGFVLSVILTAVPFWLVMGDVLDSRSLTLVIILAFAAVQIVVHMVYFLHMNSRSENGWTMMALIFTVTVVVIALSGSIWIMFHLNSNMMPTDVHQM
jgi:cytochrome o ubiquinol oxidase operon protein cyoD